MPGNDIAEWPPPCPSCGSVERQKLSWSRDGTEYRQVCQDCGHDTDWVRWPPSWLGKPKGYTYGQLAKARSRRDDALASAIANLRQARALSLAHPQLREQIEAAIREVEDLRV